MDDRRRGTHSSWDWGQRSLVVMVGIVMLLLSGCAQTTPTPITTWMTVPDYPKTATVVAHQREDTRETVIFTTTDPVTTVLAWYDTTYAPPAWHDTRGAPDAYPHLRTYTKATRKCYHFNLSIVFDPAQQTYEQTLSRFDARRCSGP